MKPRKIYKTKMTDKQIKLVRVLLFKEGIPNEEPYMALKFSEGRTSDLASLNYKETQALIEDLNGKSEKDKMTNKILSMAHELHWKLPNGKVDMDKVNAWCIKYTSSHKPLNEISIKDLPKVVSIFQKMYKEFLNTI